MNTNRKITILAGALYILGYIAGLASIASAVDSAQYLTEAPARSMQTLLAAFAQFVMLAAYLGIAVVLYPILKKFNQQLALGFLSFRIIAATFILVGTLFLILILELGKAYVNASNPNADVYQLAGELLRSGRDFVNHVAMIVSLNIGAILFYRLLMQARLVPGWLAVWGIVGAGITIVASFLVMFGVMEVITPEYMMMNVPIAIQELTLAILLIVKGFDKKALAGITTRK